MRLFDGDKLAPQDARRAPTICSLITAQPRRHPPEPLQRRLQVLHGLRSDFLGQRQQAGVVQRVVRESENVLVKSRRAEVSGLFSFFQPDVSNAPDG